MDKVTKCLDDVERKMTKLNAITSKGAENIKIKDMIKAGQKGNSIGSTIKKGVKEFKATTPTPADLSAVSLKLSTVVTLQESQLKFTIANKPVFDKMHVSGMVKKSLANPKPESTIVDLIAVLVEKAGACGDEKVVAEGKELEKRAKMSFDEAVKVYARAEGGEEMFDEAAKEDDSD